MSKRTGNWADDLAHDIVWFFKAMAVLFALLVLAVLGLGILLIRAS